MTLFVFKITFILIFSSVIITIVLFYGDWIMNIFICDDDNLICEQIKTLCESYLKMSSKNYNFYCIYFSTIFAEVK